MKLSHSILALAMALAAAPAFAIEGGGAASAMPHTDHCGLPMGEGTVAALSVRASKATIDHAPIGLLGWDAMTMDFKAVKGVDLSAFAAGDRVHFLLAQDGKSGSYRIEAICARDVSDGLHDACMGKMHETAMKLAERSGKPCDMDGMDHGSMPGMDHGAMKDMDNMKHGDMKPADEKPAPAQDHRHH